MHAFFINKNRMWGHIFPSSVYKLNQISHSLKQWRCLSIAQLVLKHRERTQVREWMEQDRKYLQSDCAGHQVSAVRFWSVWAFTESLMRPKAVHCLTKLLWHSPCKALKKNHTHLQLHQSGVTRGEFRFEWDFSLALIRNEHRFWVGCPLKRGFLLSVRTMAV